MTPPTLVPSARRPERGVSFLGWVGALELVNYSVKTLAGKRESKKEVRDASDYITVQFHQIAPITAPVRQCEVSSFQLQSYRHRIPARVEQF